MSWRVAGWVHRARSWSVDVAARRRHLDVWAVIGIGLGAGVLLGFADVAIVPVVAASLGVLGAAAIALFARRRAAALGVWLATLVTALAAAESPDGRWTRILALACYSLVPAALAWFVATADRPALRHGGALGVAALVLSAVLLPGPPIEVHGPDLPMAADAGMTPELTADIQDYVVSEMQARRIPGVGLTIVRDDEPVLLRAFGVVGTDRRDATVDTPFMLGSVSKSFTALAVMTLVEDGLMDLDAPVQEYLPWFRVDDEDESEAMTVADLLSHTSGFTTVQGGKAVLGEERSLEEDVRELADVSLARPPGEEFEYSNINFQVAGLIVEEVSGRTYAEYMRERIFEPLGMTASAADDAEARDNGLAQGYRSWFGVPLAYTEPDAAAGVPAARITSSPADMVNYLIAHLDGGTVDGTRVLPTDRIDELLSPAVPTEPGHDSVEDGDSFYGLGWNVEKEKLDGKTSLRAWHGGTVGPFNTRMELRPDEGWGVVVMVNEQSILSDPAAAIGDGVVDLLSGEDPPSAGSGFGTASITIGLTAALVVALLLRQATNLGRWTRRFRAGPRARMVVWATFLNFVLPLAVLVVLPSLVGLDGAAIWPGLFRFAPDGALVVGGTMVVLLALGVAKLILGLTPPPQRVNAR